MEDTVNDTYKRTRGDWFEFFGNLLVVTLVFLFFMLIPALGEYSFGVVHFLGENNLWDEIRLLMAFVYARDIGGLLASLEDPKYKKIVEADRERNNRKVSFALEDVFELVLFVCALRVCDVYGKVDWTIYGLFAMGGLFSISALIDLKIQELPDSITIAFQLFVLVLYVVSAPLDMQAAVLRAIIMEAFYYVLAFIGGLGYGDVKLLFPISMCLSYIEYLDFWTYTLIATFIYLIPAAILHKRKGLTLKGFKFAFGPFIIVGFFITIVMLLGV